MSGQRAAAIILASVLATSVLPPLFAWTVNQRRVTAAQSDIAAIADALRANAPALRRFADAVDILCGPGLLPRTAAGAERWTTGSRAPLSAALGEGRVPVDPWGNCYAANLTALRSDASAPVWVMSAGPNGIVETSLANPGSTTSRSNDILHQVR